MESLNISVEQRTNKGKNANRRLRAQGKLPGVVYGLGKNFTVSVDPRPLYKLLIQEGGKNTVIELKGSEVEGKHALIKDYQVDPVKRTLVHIDLLEIDMTKKITVTVPVNFVGKAAGVGEGGVLNIIEREISIKCLVTHIPQHIDVDVSALNIGDSIHAEQVKLPEGVEKGWHLDSTLVTVVPPTKEEEAAPSLAPTAEPEVINQKKPEEIAAEAKKDDKKK